MSQLLESLQRHMEIYLHVSYLRGLSIPVPTCMGIEQNDTHRLRGHHILQYYYCYPLDICTLHIHHCQFQGFVSKPLDRLLMGIANTMIPVWNLKSLLIPLPMCTKRYPLTTFPSLSQIRYPATPHGYQQKPWEVTSCQVSIMTRGNALLEKA